MPAAVKPATVRVVLDIERWTARLHYLSRSVLAPRDAPFARPQTDRTAAARVRVGGQQRMKTTVRVHGAPGEESRTGSWGRPVQIDGQHGGQRDDCVE